MASSPSIASVLPERGPTVPRSNRTAACRCGAEHSAHFGRPNKPEASLGSVHGIKPPNGATRLITLNTAERCLGILRSSETFRSDPNALRLTDIPLCDCGMHGCLRFDSTMTKCAAVGCKNTSNKLVRMNKFPKDCDRRNQWVKNCQILGNMGSWLPSSTSHLCEFHFSPEMWEKVRADGKKKLRSNAIPTIFGDSVHQVNVSIHFVCESVDTSSVPDVESQAREGRNNDSIPKKITSVIVRPKFATRVSTGVINSSIGNQDCDVIIPTCKSFNNNEESIQKCSENCESSQLSEEEEIPAVSFKGKIESINTNVLEAHEDDEELKELAVEEQSLLNLRKDYTKIVERTKDVLLEKFEKLQKMYAKSERLRIRMKKTYKRKQLAFQRDIKRLKYQVRILETTGSSISKLFNSEQCKVLDRFAGGR